ncbi:CBS domain-containing protein [Kiritimatiella glycovorans]|uniref:Serine/threonine-protein kinase RsbT n=1 Tax=Kiritimatiella glycovorans TaxID=1307763 RepID=A0A0G3EFS9_9BACT|nr:CBS domain-containing protein [Kiritimatiella glycovorans]AKJ63665.1 Serine/threonine-protein kinase RsbT [Kiritimatiella glycovorans]
MNGRRAPVNHQADEPSPMLVLDLLVRLKVRDVMSSRLITARRGDRLSRVRALMREHGITGVPIVEARRLCGLVTLETMIRALEQGFMEEPAGAHMAAGLVCLEEQMPLSFAISYFDKYSYRHFPVLNEHRELAGIVTAKDINTALLGELLKTLRSREAEEPEAAAGVEPGRWAKTYRLERYDFENAGRASTEIKSRLREAGLPGAWIRRVTIAVYEMEMNLVAHSYGGTLSFQLDREGAEMRAEDTGPGIADTARALEEGYSTATEWIRSLGFGAGMGLPNIRRVADAFDIESGAGEGTRVHAAIRLKEE